MYFEDIIKRIRTLDGVIAYRENNNNVNKPVIYKSLNKIIMGLNYISTEDFNATDWQLIDGSVSLNLSEVARNLSLLSDKFIAYYESPDPEKIYFIRISKKDPHKFELNCFNKTQKKFLYTPSGDWAPYAPSIEEMYQYRYYIKEFDFIFNLVIDAYL